MSRTKAVSIGFISGWRPELRRLEMFPLAPMIHRGSSVRRSQHTGDGPMAPRGMAFWVGGVRVGRGALPSFGLSMFCTIVVPGGEGVEPSWGRMGGQFEPQLYRSARAQGGYRVGQPVGRNPTIEEKWVKDSQHFPAELPTFQVVAGANSHQIHSSVSSFGRPSPRRRRPGPCPPWSPWRGWSWS